MKSKTRKILDCLKKFESRNVTFFEPDGSWPIIWQRARGNHVWDVEGRKYLDLTAAFGVSAAGHANPHVVSEARKQMSLLLHAMGDVHPHELKANLAQQLSALTFGRWQPAHAGTEAVGKSIFCNSGFEAVEAALKTACLATKRRGIIAFEGAYHGLGYGALNVTHRNHFRRPFERQLGQFGKFVPFPTGQHELPLVLDKVEKLLKQGGFGAVLIEPIQVRGGINIPPPSFLPALRDLTRHYGALLILDEIYTGFGRTGRWFACEHGGVIPDIICLGKALTGGFPLSVCIGKDTLMDAAWPPSDGEAIHTSTFLGHPVGCRMALAQIREIKRLRLVERSHSLGKKLLKWLQTLFESSSNQFQVRGVGLLAGVEVGQSERATEAPLAMQWIKQMLKEGYILLPEGSTSNVVAFTPPLTIAERDLKQAVNTLGRIAKKAS